MLSLLKQQQRHHPYSYLNFKTITMKMCTKTPKITPIIQNTQITPFFLSSEAPKEILKHFEPTKFVPIPSQTFYCKDSRGDELNFGAPGGDFGEFLLALDCLSIDCDFCLDFSSVAELLGKWLDERCSKERPFYLHSDLPAVTRILQEAGISSDVTLERLNKSEQKRFIELFSKFQGCGHLKLITERPKDYEIDCRLLEYLSRAFFSFYFKGDDRVLFKIYDCIQSGKALAIVEAGKDYSQVSSEESVLGLQRTSNSEFDQIFILNQHAVSHYRKHFLVPFFCSYRENLDASLLFERMERKGWRNAMLSAKSLAGDKPIYRIKINRN